METRDIELFNDGLARCIAKPGFLTRFYSPFVASSDVVPKQFEHTDLRKPARPGGGGCSPASNA